MFVRDSNSTLLYFKTQKALTTKTYAVVQFVFYQLVGAAMQNFHMDALEEGYTPKTLGQEEEEEEEEEAALHFHFSQKNYCSFCINQESVY